MYSKHICIETSSKQYFNYLALFRNVSLKKTSLNCVNLQNCRKLVSVVSVTVEGSVAWPILSPFECFHCLERIFITLYFIRR